MIPAVHPPVLPPASAAGLPAGRRRRWQAVRRLSALVLAAWVAVGFGIAWFARDLDFAFFGWPFSFWAAAQGGPIVFVVLIALYARRMSRLEAAPEPGDEGGREGAGE